MNSEFNDFRYQLYADNIALVRDLSAQWARLSIAGTDPVHVALSGGNTPKLLWEVLSRPEYKDNVKWQNLHLWWVDERCVPFDSEESNFGVAMRTLLNQVTIPKENLHPMFASGEIEKDIHQYHNDMVKFMTLSGRGMPVLDWVLLGMGEDGHTASLFPEGVPEEEPGAVCGAHHPVNGQNRISLTYKALAEARQLSFVVTGKSKAKILKQIFLNEKEAREYPAYKVWKASPGKTEWLLDKEAAFYLLEQLERK